MENRGEFGVEETVDSDGHVRLLLTGELDHATTRGLTQRLDQLKESSSPVRLDLSRLEFIDSSGIRFLLLSVREARADGWKLDLDRSVSWQVERVIKVLGIDSMLWPGDDPPPAEPRT